MPDKEIVIKVKQEGTSGLTTGKGSQGGIIQSLMGAISKKETGAAGGIGGIASSLGSVGVALGGIAAGIGLLVASSMFLQKTLGRIIQMFLRLIRPIADIFANLLQPLIWMLMPLVRLMSIIFRPFQQYLREALSRKREDFNEIGTGERPIGDMFGLYFGAIGEALGGWLGTLMSGKTGEFDKESKQYLFEGKNLGEVFADRLSEITIGDIDWQSIFEKGLGGGLILFQWDWLFEAVEKMFAIPAGDEEAFQDSFDKLITTVKTFFGIEEDDTTADKLYKAAATALNTLLEIVNPWSEEKVTGLWNTIKNTLKTILGIWWPDWKTDLKSWWTGIAEAIQGLLSWVEEQIQNARNIYNVAVREAAKIINPENAEVKEVGDLVITPGGQAFQTSPADYLFATKDPSSLGGGGASFDFSGMTIYAADAEDIKRKIDELIQENMSKL